MTYFNPIQEDSENFPLLKHLTGGYEDIIFSFIKIETATGKLSIPIYQNVFHLGIVFIVRLYRYIGKISRK